MMGWICYLVSRLKAAWVADLKADGWTITSEIVQKKNRFGEVVRFAKYRLEDRNVTGI